jgi:hypothetical protein
MTHEKLTQFSLPPLPNKAVLVMARDMLLVQQAETLFRKSFETSATDSAQSEVLAPLRGYLFCRASPRTEQAFYFGLFFYFVP